MIRKQYYNCCYQRVGYLLWVSSKILWLIIAIDLWTQITSWLSDRQEISTRGQCVRFELKGSSKRRDAGGIEGKKSRLYSCLNLGKRIWQLELHSAMPHKVRREGMLHTMQGNRKESRKEEKHSDRHASLNTRSTDTLTCKRWNCPAPTRHRKKEGGEKRVESTESGSNPSWIGHLVREEKQGKREMSNSYTKMHRHTKQVLKPIKAIRNSVTRDHIFLGNIPSLCPRVRILHQSPSPWDCMLLKAESLRLITVWLTASEFAKFSFEFYHRMTPFFVLLGSWSKVGIWSPKNLSHLRPCLMQQ